MFDPDLYTCELLEAPPHNCDCAGCFCGGPPEGWLDIWIDAHTNRWVSFNTVPPGGMSVANVIGRMNPLAPGVTILDPNSVMGTMGSCYLANALPCTNATWNGSAWNGELMDLDPRYACQVQAVHLLREHAVRFI